MPSIINDNDLVLEPEQQSVWITVDNFSVYVHRTDEGLVVDLFKLGNEMDVAIASTYAFNTEVSDEDDHPCQSA